VKNIYIYRRMVGRRQTEDFWEQSAEEDIQLKRKREY
jgi:hypothetical protein